MTTFPSRMREQRIFRTGVPNCGLVVQELWGKVFKCQVRIIYPEQERIFRNLDRLATQGDLSQADLDCADKSFRMFEAPKSVNRNWAKAELLADLALSGASSRALRIRSTQAVEYTSRGLRRRCLFATTTSSSN